MSIYDCFMFSHELDMLEIRLGTLYDHVDFFVISESDISFSGNEKQLHFKENKKRFLKWSDKIIYNEVSVPRNLPDSWSRERYSRNAAKYAVRYHQNDVILTSDLDEIPRPEVLQIAISWLEKDPNQYIVFQQKMYVNYLNNFDTDQWYGTRACMFSHLDGREISDIRLATEDRNIAGGKTLDDAGWHFTSCGDVNFIRTKIQSFSHTELNNEYVMDSIEENLIKNKDLYGREKTYRPVNIDDTFPKYLSDNMGLYSHMMYPPL